MRKIRKVDAHAVPAHRGWWAAFGDRQHPEDIQFRAIAFWMMRYVGDLIYADALRVDGDDASGFMTEAEDFLGFVFDPERAPTPPLVRRARFAKRR